MSGKVAKKERTVRLSTGSKIFKISKIGPNGESKTILKREQRVKTNKSPAVLAKKFLVEQCDSKDGKGKDGKCKTKTVCVSGKRSSACFKMTRDPVMSKFGGYLSKGNVQKLPPVQFSVSKIEQYKPSDVRRMNKSEKRKLASAINLPEITKIFKTGGGAELETILIKRLISYRRSLKK